MSSLAERAAAAHPKPLFLAPPELPDPQEGPVIVLGVLLLLIGWFVKLSLLYYIGGILLIIGVVLLVLGGAGHPVGGRRWYW